MPSLHSALCSGCFASDGGANTVGLAAGIVPSAYVATAFARTVAPFAHRLSPDFSEAPGFFVQKILARHQISIDGHNLTGRKGYNGPRAGLRRAI
jgi:hypothetical protein